MSLFQYLLAILLLFAATASCAIVNRITGGGFVAEDGKGNWLLKRWLPGKPLYWTAPLIGVIAWIWNPWLVAIAIAVAYFLWRLLPWGRWIGMGHYPPVRPASAFEAFIERLCRGSVRMSMFVRMLFAVPGLILVFYVAHGFHAPDIFNAIVWSFFLWLAYVIGWGLEPYNGVEPAEFIAGAMWGLIIITTVTMA